MDMTRVKTHPASFEKVCRSLLDRPHWMKAGEQIDVETEVAEERDEIRLRVAWHDGTLGAPCRFASADGSLPGLLFRLPPSRVAHALSMLVESLVFQVCPGERMPLWPEEVDVLRAALRAVESGKERDIDKLGLEAVENRWFDERVIDLLGGAWSAKAARELFRRLAHDREVEKDARVHEPMPWPAFRLQWARAIAAVLLFGKFQSRPWGAS